MAGMCGRRGVLVLWLWGVCLGVTAAFRPVAGSVRARRTSLVRRRAEEQDLFVIETGGSMKKGLRSFLQFWILAEQYPWRADAENGVLELSLSDADDRVLGTATMKFAVDDARLELEKTTSASPDFDRRYAEFQRNLMGELRKLASDPEVDAGDRLCGEPSTSVSGVEQEEEDEEEEEEDPAVDSLEGYKEKAAGVLDPLVKLAKIKKLRQANQKKGFADR